MGLITSPTQPNIIFSAGLINLYCLSTIATFINLGVAFVVSKGLSLNLLLLNRLREEEESTSLKNLRSDYSYQRRLDIV